MIQMNKTTILALVGMPGAGKSICVEYLESKGWPSVYFGGITLDEIKAQGLEVNAENEKTIRESIRKNEGMGAYATRMIPKIDQLTKEDNNYIVADGLYSWSEYKILKERYGDSLVVIAIAAPRKTRHERLANRPTRPLTEQEVSNREYAEIENIEKGGPIANADYTVVNDDNQNQLITNLERVLAQVS